MTAELPRVRAQILGEAIQLPPWEGLVREFSDTPRIVAIEEADTRWSGQPFKSA